MALEPTWEEQELLADRLQRGERPMTRAERGAELVAAAGFLVAAAALWAAGSRGGVEPLPCAGALLVLVLASRIEIDTPFGFTVPTQLGFVPLLFALPPAAAPLPVALALMLGRAPDVLARRQTPRRALLGLGNAWFAIGPAAVFTVAGVAPAEAGPLILLSALLAQFAVDFLVSAARFAAEQGGLVTAQLGDAWVYGIDAALSVVALVVAEQAVTAPAAALAPLPLLALLAVFAHERRQRLRSLIELNDAYRGTALVLGDVVEADDDYTGMHCKSVVELASRAGERLGLTSRGLRGLEFAALLHDVGKIAIPKSIINKPGALDSNEWRIVKTHTVEGQRILDRVGGIMRDVGRIVRSHHERWDGEGYPDGLAGEAIPIEARIISCCDSWNAMRTDRSYRSALSHEAALAELRVNAGTQFDPAVVAVVESIVAAEAPAPTDRAAVAAS